VGRKGEWWGHTRLSFLWIQTPQQFKKAVYSDSTNL